MNIDLELEMRELIRDLREFKKSNTRLFYNNGFNVRSLLLLERIKNE